MNNTEQDATSASFDRSFLPPARFEFVVMGDTHFILDVESYAIEFDSVRAWPRRAEWAIQLAAALKPDFVVHLGDLTEENSIRPQQPEARRQALAQFSRYGLHPHHVAGNMDIGDKPDPTMWSAWVTPESLETFQALLGPTWYSFDHHDLHFVVLNSQIMNGTLPEAAEQRAWFEADLAAHAGRRIVLFMHMPPFFVEEEEPDFGFYNSINQPARGWITDLLRRYQVELLFTGHTHFRAFHRVDATRFYVSPSTTTSRAGFYEAFSVAPPPEQGRNDKPKVGFFLVRVHDEGSSVHFVRTHGQTEPTAEEQSWRRLLCRHAAQLPHSPLGVYLRTPLAIQSAGALAWPSVLRQHVRDDHPFLAVVEAGIRHVRVPVSDLDDPLQRARLQLLREEGVSVTATWIWSEQLDLPAAARVRAELLDLVELQVPGSAIPEQECLESLAACRSATGKPVVLTPVIAMEPTAGKYHPRTRFGYRADELSALDARLAELEIALDRVICHVDPEAEPWDALQQFGHCLPLENVTGTDYVIGLPGADEQLHAQRVVEAIFATALQRGCRLFLDPLVDLDRTNDINHGLLDRLSNPRPAYYAAQSLNTALFSRAQSYAALTGESDGQVRIPGIVSEGQQHWLLLPSGGENARILLETLNAADKYAVIDLVRGLRREVEGVDQIEQIVAGRQMPLLISTR